jgi:hypothetical protein
MIGPEGAQREVAKKKPIWSGLCLYLRGVCLFPVAFCDELLQTLFSAVVACIAESTGKDVLCASIDLSMRSPDLLVTSPCGGRAPDGDIFGRDDGWREW